MQTTNNYTQLQTLQKHETDLLFKWEGMVENYRVIGSRHIDCITPKRGVVEVRIAGPQPGRTLIAILNFSNDTSSLLFKGEGTTFTRSVIDAMGIERALAKAGYPNLPVHGSRLFIKPLSEAQKAAYAVHDETFTNYIEALSKLNITEALSGRSSRPSLTWPRHDNQPLKVDK